MKFTKKSERCFEGRFKDVSNVFLESLMEEEISGIFHGCFMIFKGVSRVFQGSFKKTFKVFHKIFVAWHSSQLPEQKEGLFLERRVARNFFFLVSKVGDENSVKRP